MQSNEVKWLPLKSLQPNTGQVPGLPGNPRQWTEGDIKRIARSLKETPELFAARPIIVLPFSTPGAGDCYVILGGNLRSEGARRNKMQTVPCYILPSETPVDKLKEIVIKDNGSFGAWDYDALGNEWSDLPLPEWGVPTWDTEQEAAAAPQEVQEDDFDEEQDEIHIRCKKGEIWQLGEHRLMCGDSTDLDSVTKLMGGAKAQFILTDPPYGTTNIEWDSVPDLETMFRIIYQFKEVNTAIAIFGAQPFFTDLINANRKDFRYEIIWEKTMKSMYLSVNKCPLRSHENIALFYEHQPIFNKQTYTIDEKFRVRRSVNKSQQYSIAGENCYINDGTRVYGDVLFFPNWNGALFGNNENATKHPTQKPIELFAHLERMYTNEKDLVLDLFGGSGTTLIAAEQLKRQCYMMELDPHYCDVIIARWEKLTGMEAVKV